MSPVWRADPPREDLARDDLAPLGAATVPAAFQRTVARYRDRPALRTIGDGVTLTWNEVDARVRAVAAGLSGYGVGRGDPVALQLRNIPEAHIVDYAAAHLGAIPFSIFNSSAPEQIAHQLGNSGARVVITEPAFLGAVRRGAAVLGQQVRHVVLVGGSGGSGLVTLAEVEAAGDPDFDFDGAWRAITPDDLATIIYTSGTTGPPKGAQWSHRTVMAAQRALDEALPMPTDGVVSFLPMAHTGGRITVHYLALGYGATITVCPDIRELPRHIADARPDAFISTPGFWERIRAGMLAMVDADPDARAALEQAVEPDRSAQLAEPERVTRGTEVRDSRGVRAVMRPYLERLGLDNLKAAFVGGAPCPPDVSRFFRAVGVPLLEAYGSTEVSLNIFNRVTDFKPGTAGKPLPGVEIRLLDDGELLCRSELNMVGYRGDPDQTAATIDTDGWLHTGDIARIDEDGYVSIVDRKKELIITSSGKNISPANVEAAVKAESPLIAQVVAIGEGRTHVTALITLDPVGAAGCADVQGQLEAAVGRANQRLSGAERVRRFTVLGPAWAPDTEELTPTAKVRRRVIAAKYAEQIEALYS